MRLSVIFDDQRVVLNGLAYNVTLPDEPEIHAIQWLADAGEIEFRDPLVPNQAIDDPAIVAPYQALWQAAHIAANPPPTFEDRKAAKQAKINATRDLRVDKGFLFAGYRIQSRPSDRENIANLGLDARDAVAKGAVAGDYFWHPQFPDGFGFITATNETIPLDAIQMEALRARGIEFKGALTFFARQLKNQVAAAADDAALDAIDIESGWPE